MKYIVITTHDIEVGIMFDALLSHDFVAANRPVVSAGFCDREGNAYGQSISLHLSSRPVDTEILKASIARTT